MKGHQLRRGTKDREATMAHNDASSRRPRNKGQTAREFVVFDRIDWVLLISSKLVTTTNFRGDRNMPFTMAL